MDLQEIVLDGLRTEIMDRIDHLGYGYVRERLALGLHDAICNSNHDEPDDDPYRPAEGAESRYQRQADAVLALLGHPKPE